MQAIELHIITVCLVLLALDPLAVRWQQFRNWHHRRLNAKAKAAGITR